MTTTERLICLHDARAVCWACSDQDERWRTWRGGGEPPNVRRRPLPPVLHESAVPLPVLDEPKRVKTMSEGDWRRWYQRLYGKGRRG